MAAASIQQSGLVIAAGTYDGVLAGWEFQFQTNDNDNDNTTTDERKNQNLI